MPAAVIPEGGGLSGIECRAGEYKGGGARRLHMLRRRARARAQTQTASAGCRHRSCRSVPDEGAPLLPLARHLGFQFAMATTLSPQLPGTVSNPPMSPQRPARPRTGSHPPTAASPRARRPLSGSGARFLPSFGLARLCSVSLESLQSPLGLDAQLLSSPFPLRPFAPILRS
jgi:hypothetical protein